MSDRFLTSLGPAAERDGDCWVLDLTALPLLHGLSVLSRALGELVLEQARSDRIEIPSIGRSTAGRIPNCSERSACGRSGFPPSNRSSRRSRTTRKDFKPLCGLCSARSRGSVTGKRCFHPPTSARRARSCSRCPRMTQQVIHGDSCSSACAARRAPRSGICALPSRIQAVAILRSTPFLTS